MKSSGRPWIPRRRQNARETGRMKKDAPNAANAVRPRLRVLHGDEIALGPGKADLLVLIGETGSIREAAERMNMSYMRAWTLVRTINACFREPVVVSERGGRQQGGARLTESGRRALDLYQKMEADCLRITRPTWRELQKLLKGLKGP